MSNLNDSDLERLLKKYALQNAIKYNGTGNANAVLGKVLAEQPELRKNVGELKKRIGEIVEEVNREPVDTQRTALEDLAPELLERKKDRVTDRTLPPLKNVSGPVVMRFAPGPSGPLHIGHARAAVLNDEYCKSNDGRLILRFEDTNPTKIMAEAYDMIKNDLDWLGVKYHDVVTQSDRFDLYYKHAVELLEKGHAYICACDVEEWRSKKMEGQECTDRSKEPGEHLERWQKMLDGTYAEGEASYIVKTDLAHPNPAVRDFIAFRIIDEPAHIRTGDKYRVYPLMNFSVAMDDHLLGLTHVLRGKDHLNNTYRQGYLYDYLNWSRPEYIHYGWVSIEGTILKTSEILEKISKHEVKGWSDVRLGTFQALAARGIRPEAVRRYWLEVGAKEVDIKFSWDNLYAFNRELVDSDASRYFFVPDPVKINLKGINELEGRAPLHPEFADRGYRNVKLKAGPSGEIPIYVPAEDWHTLEGTKLFRLKDLCFVEPLENNTIKYMDSDISTLKGGGVKIIQWVSGADNLKMNLLKPDGHVIQGVSELDVRNAIGKLVQLERVGYAMIQADEEDSEKIRAVFCHK